MILRKMTAGVAFSAAGAFPAISGLAAQTRDESTAKMKLSIKLLSDGFPGEQDTPEGAAAEHALGLYDI